MALSESERRLLDQMEKALAAEDPKLAKTFRGGPQPRRVHPKRATAAGLGFIAGLALLVVGMMTWPGVSVIGFVAMVVCAVIALQSWRPVDADDDQAGGSGSDTPPRSTSRTPDSDSGFMDRMEERWRRRREGDL